MHDEAWWDGEDEGDAIATLQRVLAPLREAPRPWGDVIAQARVGASAPTRRGSLVVGAAALGIAAALVLAWQLRPRDAVSDANAELIEDVQPPIAVTMPVVETPPADPSKALARSLRIVEQVLLLDETLDEQERLAALERNIERNKTLKALVRAQRRIEKGKGLLPPEPEPVQDDELPQTLSTHDIKVAMDRVKPAAKACGKQHGASPKEKVKIKFTIAGTSGLPTEAFAQEPHGGTALGECIERAVLTAKFPRFRKDFLGVVYPFMF